MPAAEPKKGPLDEFVEKLGGSAEKGVRSAVTEYLNSAKGEQKIDEAVSSLKNFLFVVGTSVAIYYLRKKE